MNDEIAPMKPMRFNPVIDMEPDEEIGDLEFKVYTIKWIDGAGPVDPYNKHSQEVEKILNDGWQLDDKIISPPFVMLIFSREKETKEDE